MGSVMMPQSQIESSRQADPYRLQSIDRVVALLDMLSESDVPLSLAEICARMGLHKSTAHRSLIVLERTSMIERTLEGRFRLGLKLYELGSRAVEQIDLRDRVQPFFRRLAMEVGETVHLSVLQRTKVVYLDKVEPNRKVCMTSKPGTSNPVYCTSMGKAMLAFLPDERCEEVLNKIKFTRFTSKTLCSREALLKSLERVKKRGFAIDDEEIEMGVRCVGAPIFDENRYPIAAVSVSGPASRITVQSIPGIAEKLIRCCNEISRALGIHDRRRSRYSSPRIHPNGN